MGKKNVHKLSPDSCQTFILLGISSHENDYRLSWSINQNLGFHFVKTENHSAYNTKLKETQEFSTYSYHDGSIYYKLISNRCDNGFLLEELKNIDFLLLAEPEVNTFPAEEFIGQIKAIPFVAAAFKINISTLKQKDRLI